MNYIAKLEELQLKSKARVESQLEALEDVGQSGHSALNQLVRELKEQALNRQKVFSKAIKCAKDELESLEVADGAKEVHIEVIARLVQEAREQMPKHLSK